MNALMWYILCLAVCRLYYRQSAPRRYLDGFVLASRSWAVRFCLLVFWEESVGMGAINVIAAILAVILMVWAAFGSWVPLIVLVIIAAYVFLQLP